MTEYFPGGTEEFAKLTAEQKLSWLDAQLRATALVMEDMAAEDASPEDRRAMRDKKVQLESELVEVKINIGLMRPPEDSD